MKILNEALNILGPIAIVALGIWYASWAIDKVNKRNNEDNNYPSSPSSASA